MSVTRTTLKSSGPHDYNKSYKKFSIVDHTVDNVTKTYLALLNVPQHVSILNEHYWQEVPSDTNEEEVSQIVLEYRPDWNETDENSLSYIKNKPTLRSASEKESTNIVTENSTALVESGAVNEAINNAVLSLSYHIRSLQQAVQQDIQYYHEYPTAFVIDQRGTISDPATMVSANLIVNTNNLENAKAGRLLASTILDNSNVISASGSVGSETTNTITYLRKHSHLYVGKYDGNTMKLRQLSDTDKTKFADGSDASSYIGNDSNTNGITYDVWLKFDTDFYYRGFPLIPDDGSEPNDDLQLIVITKDVPTDPEHWEKWDSNKLIGVYKAYNTGTVLHSLGGKTPKNSISQTNSKAYARNRGTGFKLVDMQANTVMALLFYGYYSTLNSQGICGSGTVNVISNVYYPKKTGLCNSLGMTDTDSTTGNGAESPASVDIQAGEGTGIVSVNFWGLENWWGDISEWMDDLQIMQARRPSSVTTANPVLYIDDYIDDYILNHTGATGVIINIDGKDTLVTAADIDDSTKYDEDERFISVRDISDTIVRILHSNIKGTAANISKTHLGDHADVFPKATAGNYNVNYYCDYGGVYSVGGVALRSYASAYAYSGVACLELGYGAGYAGSSVGSRLLFEGNSSNTVVVTYADW